MKKTLFILFLISFLHFSEAFLVYVAASADMNECSEACPFADYFPFSYILNGEWIQPPSLHHKGLHLHKKHALLNVMVIKQKPELKYGCEVASTAMMLSYAGVKTDKMELYQRIKKDSTPIVMSSSGDIVHWGNPENGFVGDMTGKHAGYAVYDKPIEKLAEQYLPGKIRNLTNKPFEELLAYVSNQSPVVVWTTGDYRLPDRWEAWYYGKQVIKTPLDLHVVVLVGFDEQNVFINDPLSGKKQVKVEKNQFIASWKALKSRAISYQNKTCH